MAGGYVAVPGALVGIFRGLAIVMDTNRATWVPSKTQRWRNRLFDLLFCAIVPCIAMITHTISQKERYFVFAISGCVNDYDESWVSLVLAWMWPPIICLIAGYYCCKKLPFIFARITTNPIRPGPHSSLQISKRLRPYSPLSRQYHEQVRLSPSFPPRFCHAYCNSSCGSLRGLPKCQAVTPLAFVLVEQDPWAKLGTNFQDPFSWFRLLRPLVSNCNWLHDLHLLRLRPRRHTHVPYTLLVPRLGTLLSRCLSSYRFTSHRCCAASKCFEFNDPYWLDKQQSETVLQEGFSTVCSVVIS